MIEENILLAQYRQEILDQEQQIIDLEQKVEYMRAQRDHYKKDSEDLLFRLKVETLWQERYDS